MPTDKSFIFFIEQNSTHLETKGKEAGDKKPKIIQGSTEKGLKQAKKFLPDMERLLFIYLFFIYFYFFID